MVSGNTRDVTRRQVVAELKQGKIRGSCNCEVLTTGFDAPKVTHIVMARPTVSRVLYEQIVGRGLRGEKFGGTQRCTILNCEDNYKGNPPPLATNHFDESGSVRQRHRADRARPHLSERRWKSPRACKAERDEVEDVGDTRNCGHRLRKLKKRASDLEALHVNRGGLA